ncbi:dynein axonemal light chain 4-like [Sycon ciliatum]|uniref:dynein axonemal light chain 4-like n=1 Tax=Sycon ciliatum TaxID=27933 RepID=UPI0020AD1BA0|eukprot:scpid94349/ scgid9242/ Dynein light chain 4, axonemal
MSQAKYGTNTRTTNTRDDPGSRFSSLKEDAENRRTFNFHLIRHSDMADEMRADVTELCGTAGEKHPTNVVNMARMIKDTLDGKYGPGWHVVIGEGFAFEVTHDIEGILLMYFQGKLGMLVWKCEAQ